MLNMGTTKKYDIPLAHLDYKYIEECNDVKYLEKILRILRSGEEGRYPEMERQCEEKIEALNPTSRILRKEIPVRKINEIERTEGQSLQSDLQNWTSEMKVAEGSVNGGSEFDDDGLPPIRSGVISLSGNSTQQEKKSSKKNVMPRSYKEWDKFDVDKEVEEVDKEKPKQQGKSAAQPVIENVINSTGMSEREKEMKANREKDKGNEAFRAGDFQEAITYYSRSISLQPNPPSYNNRALAYLKTKEWMKAESDCNKVLSWEPQNIKALLRRGTAQKGKKCFREALADFQLVLELEPNNKRAEELIQELHKEEKKYEEEKNAKKEKGRRMVIEEVGEEEEEEEKKTRKGKKMVIEEVEEEEESADEEIVVEEKKSFEKKKATVSVKSQELNKTKTTETNKKGNKSMVNGFHKSPKQKSDSKDIWEEEEVSTQDKEGFTTLRTRPEEKDISNVESESKNIGESESSITDSRPAQSVQQTESSGLSLQEIENSENENIANASVESNRVEEEPSEKTGSHEAMASSAVVEKPPEELAPVRPVFIRYPLPGPIANLREEGNQLFREGQYGEAIHKYTEALNKLEEEKSDQVVNRSLIHSNRAACHIKTGHCAAAIKDCTAALELLPHSIKPLLRRGNAYEILENFRKAYVDYKHALNVDNTIDLAHRGSSRCQSHLQSVDGPRWREKLPRIPSVLPWEVPDIRTPEEAASSSTTSSVPLSSQKSSPSSSVSSSQTQSSSSSTSSSSSSAAAPTSTPDKATSDSSKKPAKEESFEEVKSRGNDCVKKSEFKSAIECYTRCVELDPKQTVSYTNRALCYIRIDQPEKAEQDCTTALSIEKDNVKALFRRAQAKKMLKRYKDSLSDLVHLQKVDPKNTAAQREMELVKDYWRQELKSRPTESPSSTASKAANEIKTSKVKGHSSSNEKSAQVAASSKPSAPKAAQQESSQTEEKSNSKKGKQKTRKRMVIEEVESEEKQSDSKKEIEKEAPNPSHQSGIKQMTHKQEPVPKSGHTTPTAPPPSHHPSATPTEPQGQQDSKSKKKGKKNKAAGEQSSTRPTETMSSSKEKSPAASSKSQGAEKLMSSTKPAQKSSIKATSTGLPVVPPTAPRLEKATPYEFIQAWNSLKNVSELQPYADLLKQIPPKDLPQVISNKLDGGMLNQITKCVAEKFIKQGDLDLSYSILSHLTKVPRFSTISMFLTSAEKKDIQSVFSHLQQSASSQYSSEDLSRLKKDYGV